MPPQSKSRSRRGSSLLHLSPSVTEHSTLSRLLRNVCEQDTPNALLRGNPRSWTTAWFDHAQRAQGIFDEPGESGESRCSGILTRSAWRQDISQKSLPEPPRFPNLHCCSQGQTDQVVPLQVAMKPELTSTQLARFCPVWRICDFSTLRAPISLAVRLLAFVALAAGLGSQTFA